MRWKTRSQTRKEAELQEKSLTVIETTRDDRIRIAVLHDIAKLTFKTIVKKLELDIDVSTCSRICRCVGVDGTPSNRTRSGQNILTKVNYKIWTHLSRRTNVHDGCHGMSYAMKWGFNVLLKRYKKQHISLAFISKYHGKPRGYDKFQNPHVLSILIGHTKTGYVLYRPMNHSFLQQDSITAPSYTKRWR